MAAPPVEAVKRGGGGGGEVSGMSLDGLRSRTGKALHGVKIGDCGNAVIRATGQRFLSVFFGTVYTKGDAYHRRRRKLATEE